VTLVNNSGGVASDGFSLCAAKVQMLLIDSGAKTEVSRSTGNNLHERSRDSSMLFNGCHFKQVSIILSVRRYISQHRRTLPLRS
jgi:hypothetical protein